MEQSEAIAFRNPCGEFQVLAYASDQAQCLCIKSIKPLIEAPLVRVHSSCVTSEVLGMRDCDCAEQLETAFERIGREGGLILYGEAEGRGAGIITKLNALALEAKDGTHSYAAYHQFGLPPDCRKYGLEASILQSLGLHSIRLMTNNPDKVSQLRNAGLKVARVPHPNNA